MKKHNKTTKIVIFNLIIAFVLAILAINPSKITTILTTAQKVDAAGDVPAHQKERKSNNDGTYKLSLTVKGDVTKKVAKANVIVVFDTSGSMSTTTTGRRTRLQDAKAAVNSLAQSLLAYNNKEDYPSDTIQMALVSFGTVATNQFTTPVTSYSTFSSKVDNLSASGATNWEDALQKAKAINFGDSDPTYVIFVSDGNPTVRNTQGNYGRLSDNNRYPNDDYARNNTSYDVWGLGSDNPQNTNYSAESMTRCYNEALDEAKDLAKGNYKLYTIGAYGNADRMENLATESGAGADHYYRADNTEALEDALEKILDEIENSGINNVSINDGTTNQVKTTSGQVSKLLEVDETSYKYYRNDVEWTGDDVPKAHLDTATGEVIWDLSSLNLLENEVTYKVTFDVYPSQETYDLIADLKNGKKTYDSLDENIRKYLHKESETSYSLDTNTKAYLYYNDTRTPEGTQRAEYNELNAVPTDASQMSVEKLWVNLLDNRTSLSSITMNLLRDNEIIDEITVSNDNSWNASRFISTGLLRTVKDSTGKITGIQVLDAGHDYTLQEPTEVMRHWELDIETVHPMLVDGSMQTLVEVPTSEVPEAMGTNTYYKNGDDEFYRFNGKVYYAKYKTTNTELKATNSRKSNLNVTKVVTGDALDGELFEFRFKVNSFGEKEVWYSVYDESGEIIKDLETSGTPETGDTGYFYVTNNTEFTVKMKNGDNLRIVNLETGSTYEIEEINVREAYKTTVNGKNIVKTDHLPLGATDNGNKTYTFNGITYTEKTGEDIHGKDIVYYEYEYTPKIDENKITGEIPETNTSYTFKYTNEYQKTNITVTKIWEKKEKDNVKVSLYANGEKVSGKDATLSKDNNWTYTFEDLEIRDDNNAIINYSIKEEIPDGYLPTYKGTANLYLKATNTTGDECEVTILLDNEEYKTITLTKDNKWTTTVENIEFVKENGDNKTITFQTKNNETISYELRDKQETITNREVIDIPVEKIWDDANNQDGYRPDSIDVVLLGDNTKVAEATLKKDSWKYTFEDLDKYNNGKEISYTIQEVKTDNYTTNITGNQENGYTITNTHETEKTSVKVTKVWNDANNQDGYRPANISVVLLGNNEKVGETTLTESGNWTYTFENLPKKADGKDIEYKVQEVKVDNYTTETTGNQDTGYVITNTHKTEETEVKVTKVWDDNDDQDGYRADDIKVILTGNGEKAGEVTLSEANKWTYTFTNLPKKDNGKDIEYKVQEIKVDEYTTNITGNQTTGYIITNTHETEKTSVSGTKVWDDADNQDGKRPDSIKVELLANGTKVAEATTTEDKGWAFKFEDLDKYADGQEIDYKVNEVKVSGYTTKTTGNKTTGFTITNTHEPELVDKEITKNWDDNSNQDGKRPEKITVHLFANGTEVASDSFTGTGDKWTYTFKNLPRYANGSEITYTVTEDTVAGYDTTTSGLEITNKHTILKTSICIKKEWDDNNDQDGYRPESIFVNLYANEEFVAQQEIKADEDNNWSYTFENLDQYANGSEIEYTITEETVTEYTTEVTGNMAEGYTITNSHKTEETEVKVTKVWDDNNDQDGYRPNTIKVELLGNNEKAGEVTLSEANNWTYTFEKLPKKAAGKVINYTVKEFEVEHYTTETTGNMTSGYTITNTHTPEKRDVVITKTWDNTNDKYNFGLPTSITVHLLANNVEIDSKEITAADNWSYTFTNLDKFADGKEITYTAKEETIRDYDTKENGLIINNTYNPETKDFAGTKTWDDNLDQDGARPDSINIRLIGTVNGEVVVNEPQTVEGANDVETWSYQFNGMPIYYHDQEITYTVEEETVEGYTTVPTALNVTNTYIPETVSYTVSKEWNDSDDNDRLRPTSITVHLYAGDTEIDSVEISAANNWTYSFPNLPKFANHGEAIEYRVEEDPVEEYEDPEIIPVTEYESVIVNTHTKTTISIHIVKNWKDNNDEYGYRPESITVDIYKNNEVYKTVEITEEDGWELTVDGLDKYLDGEEITYTVRERPIEQYTTSYDNYTITNNVIEPETEIEIIPPYTGIETTDNTNYFYLLIAFISTLTFGFYKVFE